MYYRICFFSNNNQKAPIVARISSNCGNTRPGPFFILWYNNVGKLGISPTLLYHTAMESAIMKCPRCGTKKFWLLSTGQKRCSQCGLNRKSDKTHSFSSTFWSTSIMRSHACSPVIIHPLCRDGGIYRTIDNLHQAEYAGRL